MSSKSRIVAMSYIYLALATLKSLDI